MVPTTMNHLIHQEDSHHEQSHHDHRQVKSMDPHMIDCCCCSCSCGDGFSVPRFHEKMKEVASLDALMHRHPKKVRIHHCAKLQLQQQQLQASQEPLDKSIYKLDGIANWPPQAFDLDSEASAKRMAILCAIASSLSYKGADAIEDVVNGMWNMWFVHFFNCKNGTQAFMFTDKEQKPNAVVIVFRGTQLEVDDWCTDGKISHKQKDYMGWVHGGFLEALEDPDLPKDGSDKGAAVADDMRTSGHPQVVDTAKDETKMFAYDVICSYLQNILRANPEARVFVTGHSLGGALAALFTALLMHKNHGIQSNVKGVFTFGQPRVGNAGFAQYMKDRLCRPNNARKYFRVVFRNDVVPRVPPDDMLFQFKHISPCVYYESFHHCEIMEEEPHKNPMPVILQPMPHIAAIMELLKSLGHETVADLRARLVEILAPAACDHSCLRYIKAVKTAPSAFLKQAT